MSYEGLITWIIISIVALALPGPDFVYITSVSLRKRIYGVYGGLGIQFGICFHLLFTYIGAITLFERFQLVFRLIQIAGALFLIYLAWSILRGAFTELSKLKQLRKNGDVTDLNYQLDNSEELSRWACFRRGFIVNILNPKCLIFMVSTLPQFLHVDPNSTISLSLQFSILSVIHILIGVFWWILLATMVNFLSQQFATPSFRCKIEIFSGVVLGLLAIALLVRVLYNIYTGVHGLI